MNKFPRTKDFRISWRLILAAMLCVILSSLIGLVPSLSQKPCFVSFLGEITILAAIVPGMAYLLGRRRLHDVGIRSFPAKLLPFIILLPIAAQPFINIVTLPANTLLDRIFGVGEIPLDVPGTLPEWFFAIGAICIAAPVLEELLCRGVIMALLKEYGLITSLSVSALGFALLHFSPSTFVVIFFLGLMLGVIRLATDSLSACIIAHAANNLAAFLLEVVPGLSESINIPMLLLCIAAFPALLYFFLVLSPRENRCLVQYNPTRAASFSVCRIICFSLYGGYALILFIMNVSELLTGVPYILS